MPRSTRSGWGESSTAPAPMGLASWRNPSGPVLSFLVALVPAVLACEQVADSNNGEEHRLQFEPADARPLAVGLGASVEILAADPDGATCFAFAGECVPARLRAAEIRSASCETGRCTVRIEPPSQVVVLPHSPGEDRLEVEACFPKLGCTSDRIALRFEHVDQIRIDCLDDACPGPATGVLVGSRVRTTVRLMGGIADESPLRVDPRLTVPRLPGSEPVAVRAGPRVAIDVPLELRATEGVAVATEGEVPLEFATVQGRVLELVLRSPEAGRAALVASVGDTRQRFAFDVIADSSVAVLRLRVADAIGFRGEVPEVLPRNVSVLADGVFESRLRLVPLAVDGGGNEAVGGADRFRIMESDIARIERDPNDDARLDLVISARGRFVLVATLGDRRFVWEFDIA